jgi:nitrite reductase (NO-forming)
MAEETPIKRQLTLLGISVGAAIVVGATIGVIIFGAPTLPRNGPPRSESPRAEVDVALVEFSIDASEAEVPRGAIVDFVVTNDGTIQHDFKIDGEDGVPRLDPGSSQRFSFGPVEAGALTAWCTIPGHREQGMEITILVKDVPSDPGDTGTEQ